MFVKSDNMNKKPITITIDPEIKIMGQNKARTVSRSLSSYIEYLIRQDCEPNSKVIYINDKPYVVPDSITLDAVNLMSAISQSKTDTVTLNELEDVFEIQIHADDFYYILKIDYTETFTAAEYMKTDRGNEQVSGSSVDVQPREIISCIKTDINGEDSDIKIDSYTENFIFELIDLNGWK